MKDHPEPFMSRSEAATYLSVDIRTITRYLEKDWLEGFRLPSGQWRIKRSSVDNLSNQGERNGNEG
jgi:excisionase family DNA binding protein